LRGLSSLADFRLPVTLITPPPVFRGRQRRAL